VSNLPPIYPLSFDVVSFSSPIRVALLFVIFFFVVLLPSL